MWSAVLSRGVLLRRILGLFLTNWLRSATVPEVAALCNLGSMGCVWLSSCSCKYGCRGSINKNIKNLIPKNWVHSKGILNLCNLATSSSRNLLSRMMNLLLTLRTHSCTAWQCLVALSAYNGTISAAESSWCHSAFITHHDVWGARPSEFK